MHLYKAFMIEKKESDLSSEIQQLEKSSPKTDEVLVKVSYSGINYKDALAVSNSAPIIRNYPMIPGIDLSGIVEDSASSKFSKGDQVFATGWGLGETQWGGYTEYALIKENYLLKIPEALDLKTVMTLGTAGLTAMLSIMRLENMGLTPEQGEVIVTGATGGLGSIAIYLLNQLNYKVVASTGRKEYYDYINALGADRIIDRLTESSRPLDTAQWSGAIDSVGGTTLSTLFSQMHYGSSIAACGLAGGHTISTTVYPFIIRGINLLGIDSVYCEQKMRSPAWERIAKLINQEAIQKLCFKTISLEDIPEYAEKLLNGQIYGRINIDLHL